MSKEHLRSLLSMVYTALQWYRGVFCSSHPRQGSVMVFHNDQDRFSGSRIPDSFKHDTFHQMDPRILWRLCSTLLQCGAYCLYFLPELAWLASIMTSWFPGSRSLYISQKELQILVMSSWEACCRVCSPHHAEWCGDGFSVLTLSPWRWGHGPCCAAPWS